MKSFGHPIYQLTEIELNSSKDKNVPSEWTDSAACIDQDPDLMFSAKTDSIQAVKKICNSCVVKIDCLDYALENEEKFGIWGGLTPRERKKLAKHESKFARFASYLGLGKFGDTRSIPSRDQASIAWEDVVDERFPVSMTVNLENLPPVSSFDQDYFNKSERFWL